MGTAGRRSEGGQKDEPGPPWSILLPVIIAPLIVLHLDSLNSLQSLGSSDSCLTVLPQKYNPQQGSSLSLKTETEFLKSLHLEVQQKLQNPRSSKQKVPPL